MSKIRFIVDNYIDAATLTTSPTLDTSLTIENAKNISRSKVARSVDSSNLSVRGNFDSVKDVSSLVIGSHNFVLGMQYQMYLYSDISTDTKYAVTGGTEGTNDNFYIDGSYANIFVESIAFDVYNDTNYSDACIGGTNNILDTKGQLVTAGDTTSIYTVGLIFTYSGDTTDLANRTYTVVSSTFSTNTTIVVEENTNSATFDGTLYPHARYTVNTGGAIENSTTYAVIGGSDNISPINDVFYVTGDQTAIFDRASSISYTGDTNTGSNIVYTYVSSVYNAGSTRTEITVEDDVTGHAFNGILLPIYTTVPVTSNTITTPTFDGEILPNFQLWTSGIKDITTETVGSSLWEWGYFAWGLEGWGTDRVRQAYTPPAHIVEWITDCIPQVRGFKIDIFLSEGSSSYFEFGRLIVGNYIQPTFNIGFGHSLSWEENTKQYRTDAGTLRSDISVPYRKLDFNIGTINETDRILLQHELRNVGMRKDLFVSLFPEDSSNDKKIDYSGIFKITKVPTFTEFAQNYYKSKYSMEEV